MVVSIAVNMNSVPRKVVAMKRSVRTVSVWTVHCRFLLELCFIRTIVSYCLGEKPGAYETIVHLYCKYHLLIGIQFFEIIEDIFILNVKGSSAC